MKIPKPRHKTIPGSFGITKERSDEILGEMKKLFQEVEEGDEVFIPAEILQKLLDMTKTPLEEAYTTFMFGQKYGMYVVITSLQPVMDKIGEIANVIKDHVKSEDQNPFGRPGKRAD